MSFFLFRVQTQQIALEEKKNDDPMKFYFHINQCARR